jgi:hypothetical protein
MFGIRRDEASSDYAHDLGLRALFSTARAVIDALEQGVAAPVLNQRLAAYVGCAAGQGVSRARIRLALEWLVREHALRLSRYAGAPDEPSEHVECALLVAAAFELADDVLRAS